MKQQWPNFFIVGAAKSGTTSLHEYLARINGIYMSPIKEPNFFLEEVGPLYGHLLEAHFADEREYLSLFKPKHGETILGESSVTYLCDDKAAGRIHDKVPDARIVIILRDPIERAYSHFLHHLKYGFETSFDFLEAIKSDYNKERKGIGFAHMYIEYGLYSHQIQRYFDLFGRSRVKVIIYEDEFRPKTKETVQDVVYFLGLNNRVPDEVVREVFNISSVSGSLEVPRSRAVSMMNNLVRSIRGNNVFLKNLIHPVSSVVWRRFLVTNKEKPPLAGNAVKFLKEIYRADVQELPKILEVTPSWATSYH
jgi:hypothetical protein